MLTTPAVLPSEYTYRIAPSRLEGSVSVCGAKNSVLRLLAASLLTAEPVRLLNYPAELLDAQVQVAMLERLGKRCDISEGEIRISESGSPASRLEWEGRSIRNTLLTLGALVARTGFGAVPLPGGCQIGDRKHDLHEMLLRRLGAEVWEEKGMLCAAAEQGLEGGDIHLPIRSTGATENAILCASLARGTTRIWNPHVRPEILDLVSFLQKMGAGIEVLGQEQIAVKGVESLRGAVHTVMPDNLEAITWVVAAVMTGGDIEIENFPFRDLEVPMIHLRESGAKCFRGEGILVVRGGVCRPVEISTGPYPGINSDMQPLFAVFGACAKGESRIVDLRFPGRYSYAAELGKMGMKYRIENNLLQIEGGDMTGAEVTATDLRAGVALTLAGLVARGETVVRDAWQVERGYNQFLSKLQGLGAQIGFH